MRRAALTLFVLLLAAAPAAADIMPEDHHSRQMVVVLDFGPYADYTTRVHAIAKGETLETIAKAKLGKAARWKEIVALNPRLDPKNLHIGQSILLPPAKKPLPAPKAKTQGKPAPKAGAQHWWHIISVPQPSWDLLWCSHGQAVPVHHYGTTVIAVRDDMLASFRKSLEDPKTTRWKTVQALMKKPPAWFAAAPGIDAGRGNVHDNDPTYHIVKRMRITSIGGGAIRTKLLSTRYLDQHGRELKPADIKRAKIRRSVILFLIAGIGLAGLVFVVLRRRSAATATA
ncbi:MAG: LysM domain-containing protein [Planctomycetota bacterium]|nr:LysM domain-containing protein [Planctomycetota bacterium]